MDSTLTHTNKQNDIAVAVPDTLFYFIFIFFNPTPSKYNIILAQ